jgi:hypothetical protein
VQAGVAAVAEADRGVHVVAGKVGECVRGKQFQIPFRVRLDEAADARRHPARGKRGQHRDDQPALAVAGANLARGIEQGGERGPHLGRVAAARIGEPHTLAVAGEQRDAEVGFQRANLVAHGAVRDEQLVGGAGEALVPRRGLECLDRVQYG